MFLITLCGSCDSTDMRVHSYGTFSHIHIPVEGQSKFLCSSVHVYKLTNRVMDVNDILNWEIYRLLSAYSIFIVG